MDFEKYIRQSLENHQPEADDRLWEKIAAQQPKPNFFKKIRQSHMLRYAAAVTGAVAIGFFTWKKSATSPDGIAAGLPTTSQQVENTTQIVEQPVQPDAVSTSNMAAANINKMSQPWRKQAPPAWVGFKAEQGLEYLSPQTGTRVNIAPGSLVHADGSPVYGTVQLQLREFRNAADFVASGLPMHFGDERGDYFFNSGGMFDLLVTQGEEPLRLAAGETAQVRFTSTHTLRDASLYYFDEVADKWVYAPNAAFSDGKTPSALAPAVDEAVAVADNLGQDRQRCLPINTQIEPSKVAAGIREAVKSGLDYAEGKIAVPKWFRKNSHMSDLQLLYGLDRGLVKLTPYNDISYLFYPEDLKGNFTELRAFKDVYFVTQDSFVNAKSLTGSGIYWEFITVKPLVGDQVKITLRTKTHEVDVYATMHGTTENKNFDPGVVMAEYKRLYKERSEENQRIITKWRIFTSVAAIWQSQDEWCMNTEQWFDYFEANRPLMRTRYAQLVADGLADSDTRTAEVWDQWRERLRDVRFAKSANLSQQGMDGGLTYALRLSNFGTYNCDQIFRLAAGNDVRYILAGFQTKEGAAIIPRSISIIDDASKLFFTLAERNKMLYVPNRQFEVIIEDVHGKYHRLRQKDYAVLDLKGKEAHTFTLQSVAPGVQTAREWANELML
jgi:hypothetical protein